MKVTGTNFWTSDAGWGQLRAPTCNIRRHIVPRHTSVTASACDARNVQVMFRQQAATQSELNTGSASLLEWINRRQIPIALITNNSRQSLATVLDRHQLSFFQYS